LLLAAKLRLRRLLSLRLKLPNRRLLLSRLPIRLPRLPMRLLRQPPRLRLRLQTTNLRNHVVSATSRPKGRLVCVWGVC
jgi:hypothetical protein